MGALTEDKEIYRYRHEVHCYLDVLWLISSNKGKARNLMYKWLAIQMDKDTKDFHVSNFDINDCRKALHILKAKYKQLTGKRNIPKSIRRQFHCNQDGKYDKELINKICGLNTTQDKK